MKKHVPAALTLLLWSGAFALAVAMLSACVQQPPDRVVDNRMVTGKIVSINQPKHFSIAFEVEGHVYGSVGNSKHCNSWRRNRVGDMVTTQLVTYEGTRRDGATYRYVEFPRLNGQLCS